MGRNVAWSFSVFCKNKNYCMAICHGEDVLLPWPPGQCRFFVFQQKDGIIGAKTSTFWGFVYACTVATLVDNNLGYYDGSGADLRDSY